MVRKKSTAQKRKGRPSLEEIARLVITELGAEGLDSGDVIEIRIERTDGGFTEDGDLQVTFSSKRSVSIP